MDETQVVFGAAGALGAAIVRRLTTENRPVRVVVRDAVRARKVLPASADIITGDAIDAESVRAACRKASIIYHCVNVTYSKWTAVMPTVTDNILMELATQRRGWSSLATFTATGRFRKYQQTRIIRWLQ